MPAQLRLHAEYLQGAYKVSERRACRVLNLQRSSYRYQSVADEQAALRIRIRDLAAARVSYGYRRIHVLLQREGWRVNHKRVYRLYRQEGLLMRPKPPRRRVACQKRLTRPLATSRDESWSMDFMSDELVGGHRIRLLTIVDNFTRESLAIAVETSFPAHRVVEVLDRLAQHHRLPKTIRVDNGPEFTSKVLDQWAYLRGVQLDFSRPGKPTDNAFIEAFNARVRQECLNENWFLSLEDAREKVAAWRRHYNTERPHGALGNLPPAAFARAAPRSVG
jgi:putative transposase